MRRLALIACLLLPLPAAAQGQAEAGRIVMTGTAEVEAMPDAVAVSAGVSTVSKTARAALDENNRRMTSVLAVLEEQGVPKAAIGTSGFGIGPEWEHGPQGSRQVGYRVSNTVTVRLDDVTRVGGVLDALVRGGANEAGGVTFSVKDADALLDGARARAFDKARSRAAIYAEAAGLSLGPVVEIREGGGDAPFRPVPVQARMEAVPMEPGTQSLSVSVTVTWRLDGQE